MMKLSLNDFGIRPGTHEDAMPALLELLKTVRQLPPQEPVEIFCEKGRYDFFEEHASRKICYISNHDQLEPERRIAFLIEHRDRVTIDGRGSDFFFHGILIPFAFLHARNVFLKNLSVDSEFPQLHQFRILEVNPAEKELTGEIVPFEKPLIRNGNQLCFAEEHNPELPVTCFMSFEPDGKLIWNIADRGFCPEKITETAPGILKITGIDTDYRKGNALVFRPSGRPAPGIFLHHADDFRADHVTVHYAFGMGLLAQNTKNISLNAFRVCRRGASDPRLFTAQADATHFSGCSGKIISENGLYEGMADDAINVHGTYLRILERKNETVLRAAYMHKQCYGMDWAAPGDRIAVLRSDTMEALPEMWTLKSIRPADAETGTKKFELELDHPLPVFEDGVKYGIENLSRTPEVEFRNNIVRNNRARGALFSTPERIVCEDNFFDHPHGSAILLCGDCNGWYETGACHDVLIRNNRFLNCLTARYQFTEAVISVCPEIPELNRQKKYFHSGIRIENNLFETFDEPILFVKSADDVTFRENRIIRNTDFPAFHPNRNAVILKNVRDFRHENNIPELTDRDIRKS